MIKSNEEQSSEKSSGNQIEEMSKESGTSSDEGVINQTTDNK